MIDSFTVMDYTNGIIQIEYPQTNVELINNNVTSLDVEATIIYNTVNITTDQLPLAGINEPYSFQLTAEGGTEPYHWDIKKNYSISESVGAFPNISAHQLNPYNTDGGWAEQEIQFDFPFYGKYYNRVYVHVDGQVMFRGDHTPWTFVVDEMNLFKNFCNISVFGAKPIVLSSGDGIWYEGNPNFATFRWKASVYGSTGTTDLNFALKIYPDGSFEMYYGDIQSVPWLYWISGISDGTMEDFQTTRISNLPTITPGTILRFEPDFDLTEFTISDDGLLQGTATFPYEAKSIKFKVTDNNGISDIKEFIFSTIGVNNLVIRNVSILAGDDDLIEYGENVLIGITLENISTVDYNDVSMVLHSADPLIVLIDSIQTLGSIPAGQTISYNSIFEFSVSGQITNSYPIHLNTAITANNDLFNSEINLLGYAPDVVMDQYMIIDGNNGFLEPGETAEIQVSIYNQGGADASTILLQLSTSDQYMTVLNGNANLDGLSSYGYETVTFTISCSAQTPMNYFAAFDLQIDFGSSVNNQEFIVPVGIEIENFESGSFNNFDWEFGGNAPWEIVNQGAYEGTYCMKSGEIGDNGSSSILLDVDVITSGTISFYYKVSSESSYDFLEFYVDEQMKGQWSGEELWTQAQYDVSAGSHTFRWVFSKDYSVSGGSDCAWIDMIVFPPLLNETIIIYAGDDSSVCAGNSQQLSGSAVNASTYLWTTGGDGIFDNSSILAPIYNPGIQDISYGSVFLTLTASNTLGNSVSDSMILTIHPIPEVQILALPDFCSDDAAYELNEGIPSGGVYAGNGIENGYFNPQTAGIGIHLITYTYSNEFGCANSDTSTLIVMDCTGFGDENFLDFPLLFPNPATDQLFVDLKNAASNDNMLISIRNVVGEVFWQQKIFSGKRIIEIDVKNLKAGVYILTIDYADRQINRKVSICR